MVPRREVPPPESRCKNGRLGLGFLLQNHGVRTVLVLSTYDVDKNQYRHCSTTNTPQILRETALRLKSPKTGLPGTSAAASPSSSRGSGGGSSAAASSDQHQQPKNRTPSRVLVTNCLKHFGPYSLYIDLFTQLRGGGARPLPRRVLNLLTKQLQFHMNKKEKVVIFLDELDALPAKLLYRVLEWTQTYNNLVLITVSNTFVGNGWINSCS